MKHLITYLYDQKIDFDYHRAPDPEGAGYSERIAIDEKGNDYPVFVYHLLSDPFDTEKYYVGYETIQQRHRNNRPIKEMEFYQVIDWIAREVFGYDT